MLKKKAWLVIPYSLVTLKFSYFWSCDSIWQWLYRKKKERAEREKREEEARLKREKEGKPWIKEVDDKEAEEFIAQAPRKRQESDSCIREVTDEEAEKFMKEDSPSAAPGNPAF